MLKNTMTLIGITLLLILSACGGGGDTADNGGDDVNGGAETTADERGWDFAFTATGAAEAEVNDEVGDLGYTANDLTSRDVTTIHLSLSSDLMSFNAPRVTFENIPYEIDAPAEFSLEDPAVGADGVTAQFSNSTRAFYSSNVNGTLTVSEYGETMSGEFSFTADYEGETVEVTGSFTTIPVPEDVH